MLFGSNRDFDLLVQINRELLKDIVEQEILYHKLSIADSEINLYGESMQKSYYTAVKLNCLITRGDQVIDIQEFGPNGPGSKKWHCLVAAVVVGQGAVLDHRVMVDQELQVLEEKNL